MIITERQSTPAVCTHFGKCAGAGDFGGMYVEVRYACRGGEADPRFSGHRDGWGRRPRRDDFAEGGRHACGVPSRASGEIARDVRGAMRKHQPPEKADPGRSYSALSSDEKWRTSTTAAQSPGIVIGDANVPREVADGYTHSPQTPAPLRVIDPGLCANEPVQRCEQR